MQKDYVVSLLICELHTPNPPVIKTGQASLEGNLICLIVNI